MATCTLSVLWKSNEDNSTVATSQFVVDALVGWKKSNFEISPSVQNLLNTEYNDAQFDTESRLKDEPALMTVLHFTPGAPFF